MEKEFLDLVKDYTNFLTSNDVNMDKIRFVNKPIFLYDIDNDIVEPNTFYNGKPIVNGRIKKAQTNLYTIEIDNIKGLCDNLELGLVIVVNEPLTKKYVLNEWVIEWYVGILDNMLKEDNNWDYLFDKEQEGHTILELMEVINKDLLNESGAPTEYVVINEKTFIILDNNKLISLIDDSYFLGGLRVKVNSSLNDDLISFSNKFENRVLKITGFND